MMSKAPARGYAFQELDSLKQALEASGLRSMSQSTCIHGKECCCFKIHRQTWPISRAAISSALSEEVAIFIPLPKQYPSNLAFVSRTFTFETTQEGLDRQIT